MKMLRRQYIQCIGFGTVFTFLLATDLAYHIFGSNSAVRFTPPDAHEGRFALSNSVHLNEVVISQTDTKYKLIEPSDASNLLTEPSPRETIPKEGGEKIDGIFKILRKSDKRLVKRLLDLDVDKLTDKEAMDTLYQIVAEPLQGVCRTLKRFGGVWFPWANTMDGDKFICLDNIISKEKCIVYSFGINNEWSFEDIVDEMGCKVYAYDHSINATKNRGSQIEFFKTGVSTQRTENMDTLENLIAANGHNDGTQISYLKIDIERAELKTLPQWIESGVFSNIDQVALEFHLAIYHFTKEKFKDVLKWLQELYKLNFRIISYEPNTAIGPWGDDGYYSFFEVVFMKDTVWNHLDLQ